MYIKTHYYYYYYYYFFFFETEWIQRSGVEEVE